MLMTIVNLNYNKTKHKIYERALRNLIMHITMMQNENPGKQTTWPHNFRNGAHTTKQTRVSAARCTLSRAPCFILVIVIVARYPLFESHATLYSTRQRTPLKCMY